jgi:hypothetical protein
MKGHPTIYLLAVAVTACLIGCVHSEYQHWHGPIPLNTISAPELYEDTTNFRVPFTLEILSIQQLGTDEVIYPPAGQRKTLWLKAGQYRARISCKGKPGDVDFSGIEKTGEVVGEDQFVDFSLKLKPQGTTQSLDCVIDASGKVFAGVVEGLEVVIDDY